MITGTDTEGWIAVGFFIICGISILSDFEKKNLPPQLMRILCLSLMVVGGYTCINGFANLGFIGEMLEIWSRDGNFEKMMEARRGVVGMILLTGLPILAILFGGITFITSLTRYKKV